MEKAIAYITSLIGDPIRTNILWTLIDGKAYTATELAIVADTSPQNISMHLGKLVQADLLSVESQGRHKYYRLSKPEVAYALEAISNIIPTQNHRTIVDNQDNFALKYCRTCYDHLAGKVGVLLTEALLKQKIIAPGINTYTTTKRGETFFSGLGIDISELKKQRRAFARPCLDWSERKHHLAGSLGAALLNQLLSLDYIRRKKNTRAVLLTPKGEQELYDSLKIVL